MEKLTSTFYDSKWVKIPLYFVSILSLFRLVEKRFTEGKWPDENTEIFVVILLCLYVITDLFVIYKKKAQKTEKDYRKIDEIGTSE